MSAGAPASEDRPCPSCGQPVWPGDNFCEACRAPLTPSATLTPSAGQAPAVPTPAVPTPAVPAPAGPAPAGPASAAPTPAEQVAAGAPAPGSQNGSAARCQACGSGPISADGYCEACGRKAPSARDHSETDLGPLAGVTDRGLRHYRNEDAMALAATETPRGTVLIAIVCDGVSGSTRADEASAAAAEAAIRVLIPAVRAGQDAAEASLQAVQAAQAAVAGLVGPPGQTAPQDAPSATFVSAVVSAESVTVCSLGDSRAYWLDATATSAAKQLSTDDSVVAQLVTAGLLSEAAALDAPQAHVVTGWLGADVSGTEPHIATFAPPGPGVVLLCSDGLWNYEPEAARLAARVLPAALTGPLAAARTLTDFALQAGGHDNITVVLAPLPLLRSADDPVPFSGDVPAEGSPPTRGQGDDDE